MEHAARATLDDAVVPAVESTLDTNSSSEDVHQLGDGCPETRSIHEKRHHDHENIDHHKRLLLPAIEVSALVEVEPEDSRKSVAEPREGTRGADRENGVKDGDRVGQAEADDPEGCHQGQPDDLGLGGVAGDEVEATDPLHDEEVDVLGADVSAS